ncbi:MAG: hypothetical protein KC478_04270 [Bacteriovoracaceae bacterium]|nr:hypothetical protein [Bacteriovoracaceae bacterium]
MKKDKRCVICKHMDSLGTDNLNYNHVYSETGQRIDVLLCRKHDVELFQMGQRAFFLKHHKMLLNVVGSDEGKFISLMGRTVQKYYNQIY